MRDRVVETESWMCKLTSRKKDQAPEQCHETALRAVKFDARRELHRNLRANRSTLFQLNLAARSLRSISYAAVPIRGGLLISV